MGCRLTKARSYKAVPLITDDQLGYDAYLHIFASIDEGSGASP